MGVIDPTGAATGWLENCVRTELRPSGTTYLPRRPKNAGSDSGLGYPFPVGQLGRGQSRGLSASSVRGTRRRKPDLQYQFRLQARG
jgi:hypothetical protein